MQPRGGKKVRDLDMAERSRHGNARNSGDTVAARGGGPGSRRGEVVPGPRQHGGGQRTVIGGGLAAG